MHNVIEMVKDIYWVGDNDHRLELFENLIPLPDGVSYNAYLIRDEKNTLMDTVDSSIFRQALDNILYALNGEPLHYLVVNHVEPDHCAMIEELAFRFPEMKIVGNAKTFCFIERFYSMDLKDRYHTVKDGDTLSLGKHSLSFVFTPMVHWPEVMMCYESTEKILFSADAFGTFGVVSGNLFARADSFNRIFMGEARRYYTNIVGKFGQFVQKTLAKAATLDIAIIAPLHGPVWKGDLNILLEKYNLWSSYTPENKGVALFYASMYGNTKNAVEILAKKLEALGVEDIRSYDVSKTDPSYLIAESFRVSHLVFAAPTYNLGLFYKMANFMHELARLNFQNRKVCLIGNGTWAPTSLKDMQAILDTMKNMEVIGTPLQITSMLREDQMADVDAMAQAIVDSMRSSNIADALVQAIAESVKP